MIVDLILRWLHILSAITLVGGTFFLRFVWYPSTASMTPSDRESHFSGMRGGWSKLVMASTLFLLVSGLVNAVTNIKRYELDPTYHMLVAGKLLVALAMFFFCARVAGRSESAVKFRESIGKWLTINSLLALLLVGMAGYMKLVPHVPKPIGDANPTEVGENDDSRVPSTTP